MKHLEHRADGSCCAWARRLAEACWPGGRRWPGIPIRETGRAAGTVRRALAVREGGPLAQGLEDAGDGFLLHSASGDSVGTITPSSLHYERHHCGHPDDRSVSASTGHSRHGRSAALVDHGGDPAPAVDHAHAGAGVRRQQRGRMGAPGRAPTSSAATAWSVAASGPACRSPLLLAEVGVQPRRVVGDCGRRGCLPDGAQHPAVEGDWTTSLLAYGQNGETIRPVAGLSAAAHQSRAGKATRT